MKKGIVISIVAIMGLTLTACSQQPAANKTKSTSTSKVTTSSSSRKKTSKIKRTHKHAKTVAAADQATHDNRTKATVASESSVTSSQSSSLTDSTQTDADSSTATSSTVSSSASSAVSSTSSQQSKIKQIDWEEAAELIIKGGFVDFNEEAARDFSEGSRELANGGFEMRTYPGAKGIDIFKLTPHADGSVDITAQYGSLDGGFGLLPDQSMYGPSSATVQR
ncbi:hypothetical protein [Lactiplantibacillus modestisalitolerans]|uniref:Lipoprotein n=1 Tax=Lactiplantibacillus modestisalitolerans TaxID=1457219 RepID=A0ABV5WTI1_9LACO|nr:hypothetical protein [Lactiplantibacillus modestisalitolerans]